MDVSERLTLEAWSTNSLEALEHVHRYLVAAEVCEGSRVIDLCCGSGYGARILRDVCPAVTGVDNDEATINRARATFGGDGEIEFEAADALDVLERPLPESFDAIVMLEGLEHLADPERAVDALRRHSDAGLKLVLSIPNSRTFGEVNPFHVSDFGYEDVLEICSRLGEATILYQFLAEGSVIRAGELGEDLGACLVGEDRGELEYANHFFVCVNGTPDQMGSLNARMQLAVAPTYNRYMLSLQRGNDELRRANARLGRSLIGVADSAGASLLAQVDRLTKELEETRSRIDEEERVAHEKRAHDDWIDNLHEQIETHKRKIQEMETTRVWRLAGRYWGARERLRRSLHPGRR